MRDEHIAYQQQEAKVQRERQEDLLMREAKARGEVMKVVREKRKRLQQREVSFFVRLKSIFAAINFFNLQKLLGL